MPLLLLTQNDTDFFSVFSPFCNHRVNHEWEYIFADGRKLLQFFSSEYLSWKLCNFWESKNSNVRKWIRNNLELLICNFNFSPFESLIANPNLIFLIPQVTWKFSRTSSVPSGFCCAWMFCYFYRQHVNWLAVFGSETTWNQQRNGKRDDSYHCLFSSFPLVSHLKICSRKLKKKMTNISVRYRAALGRVCLKLVIVMGVTWIVDVLSWAIGGPHYIW